MTVRQWLPTIGLEIHVELDTRTKMFCVCPRVESVAASNRATCPVCLGLPGALPVVNAEAVRLSVRAALALGATVRSESWFARKNYFYPDLVKGYQISQGSEPLGAGGSVVLPDGTKVPLRRIHLEEDTARLLTTAGAERMGMDCNRSGVPLLEIVTEPSMHSAAVAEAYARAVRALLVHLGVTRGRIECGELRVEANVSVAPVGSTKLGMRVEIKNQAGFAHMRSAVEFEIARQIAVLEAGGDVCQETRGWDPTRGLAGETFVQRAKEDAHDYRYFPEPDLPVFRLPAAWLREERARVDGPDGTPALFAARMERAGVRTEVKEAVFAHDAADFVRQAEAALSGLLSASRMESPLAAASNGFARFVIPALNAAKQNLADSAVTAEAMAAVLAWLADGRVGPDGARRMVARLAARGGDPETVARDVNAFLAVDGGTVIDAAMEAVLEEHADWVVEWRAGKTALRHALLGAVMKRLGRGHDASCVALALDKALSR
jgi:aspartyl-tRNA(Asn)/glutamyl-tRNA(Gln) amidotransferase subunit B